MLRERKINADPGGRVARFLSGIADVGRWPFERLYWAVEERLVWPLQERAGGWDPPGRSVGAGALAAVAVAAALLGALSLTGGDAPRERVAAPTRVAIAAPPPQPRAEQPQEPALQGAPPSFGVGKGVGVAQAENGGSGEAENEAGASAAAAEAGAESSQPEASAGATASAGKPVPAGPAAMKVARRFSEAFVFYEIGERPARAKTVFGETATPQLAEALTERPPRQPESAEVPQARVVNLVAGPRAGKAYTVSVSLLRVGLTTELRLEMRKQQGTWLVTDVRG